MAKPGRERKANRRTRQRVERSLEAGGLWGEGPLTRSDLRLVRHAANADWPAPDPLVGEAIVRAVMDVIKGDDARRVIAAARTVIALEGYNQRRDHEAIDRAIAKLRVGE